MVPPTIPTSFVPKTPGKHRKVSSSLINALSVFAYIALAVSIMLAIGVFLYGRVLSTQEASANAELKKATASIDPTTVQSFVRLQNRLNAGSALLSNHTAFSLFFNTLDQLLPKDVRFSNLSISYGEKGAINVTGGGTAASFNALAAASQAFASNNKIKDALFSKMSVKQDGTVSFGFSATIDPSLIQFSANAVQAQLATSTASSTGL